jgi:hypothetical protein
MFSLFLQDAWKVLLYSLLLGAGLPVLYAVGIRAAALGTAGADGTGTPNAGRHTLGRVLAGICFAVVIAGVAIGLLYIVASGQGKMLSFEHGFPTFVPKS